MATLPAPGIAYEGVHCRLTINRPAAGIALVILAGSDIGEFGDLPMRERDALIRNLNSALVSETNPMFGSDLPPITGFRQPFGGTGAPNPILFGFRVLRNGQEKRLRWMGKIIDALA